MLVPLGFVVFAFLFLWAMTGEWPELVVPGSRAGSHEVDWYKPDRGPRLQRLRRLTTLRRVARHEGFAPATHSAASRAEITWRVWRAAHISTSDVRVPTHLDLVAS